MQKYVSRSKCQKPRITSIIIITDILIMPHSDHAHINRRRSHLVQPGPLKVTRKCTAVSGTTGSCCQSAQLTDITLWWHQSSDSAIRQMFNSRWPGVLGCWTSCLEHSAGGDNDIAVTPYFPSSTKNLALQEIISGHHHVNQNLLKLYN